MKKRLSLLVFSALLAFTAIDPGLVKGQVTNTSNQQVNSSIGALNNKQSLNNNANIFLSIVTQAEQSIGSDRVLLLLSSGLGVSLTTMQAEFATANLSLGNFVLAQIMARQLGVPTGTVISLFNQNMRISGIARQLGISQNGLFPIIKSFARALNSEIGFNNGTLQPDAQRDLRKFRKALLALDNNFNQFSTRLGNDAFNTLLIEQLSLQTGLTRNQLATLRTGLSTDITSSQFAIALLTASSITAITPNGSINNINLINLLTPAGIQSALITSAIPFQLLTSRVSQFDNVVTTAAGGNSVITNQVTSSNTVSGSGINTSGDISSTSVFGPTLGPSAGFSQPDSVSSIPGFIPNAGFNTGSGLNTGASNGFSGFSNNVGTPATFNTGVGTTSNGVSTTGSTNISTGFGTGSVFGTGTGPSTGSGTSQGTGVTTPR